MRNFMIAVLIAIIVVGVYLAFPNNKNQPDFIREITSAPQGSDQYYRDLTKYYREILAWEKSQSKQAFGAEHLKADVSVKKAVLMQQRDYIRKVLAARHD